MAHSLAPHFVKLFYTSSATPHVQTLQCGFVGAVSPGSEPDVALKGGLTQSLSAAVTAWCDIMKNILKTTDTFTGYEAYGVDMVTGDPFYIYGDDLAIAGIGTGSNLADGQAVFSYGTAGGNVLKIYVMEPIVPQNARVANKVTAANPVGTFTTYILGSSNWIKGRDDTFPIRGIYYTTKINDALRKKTLLSS